MSTPNIAQILAAVKPYVCPVKGCGAGFDELSEKKHHVRYKHSATKLKAKR